jgi:hypothetical protein
VAPSSASVESKTEKKIAKVVSCIFENRRLSHRMVKGFYKSRDISPAVILKASHVSNIIFGPNDRSADQSFVQQMTRR